MAYARFIDIEISKNIDKAIISIIAIEKIEKEIKNIKKNLNREINILNKTKNKLIKLGGI